MYEALLYNVIRDLLLLTMSISFLRTAKCKAVSPLAAAAFNCSDVSVFNSSLHIDWLPASTARRRGILPR